MDRCFGARSSVQKKGPFSFYERERMSVLAEGYRARRVPFFYGIVVVRPDLLAIPDNAPSHKAITNARVWRKRYYCNRVAVILSG